MFIRNPRTNGIIKEYGVMKKYILGTLLFLSFAGFIVAGSYIVSHGYSLIPALIFALCVDYCLVFIGANSF